MKALIIHPFLGSHYKAIIFSEIQKIAQKNPFNELHVIQMFENEASRKGMTSQGTSIHRYPFITLFNSDSEKPSTYKKIKAIYRVVKEQQPDIINVTGYYDWAVNLIMILSKLKGIRIVMSIDSTLMDQTNSWLKRVIKSFLLFWPDTFYCYGTKSRELVEHFGRPVKDVFITKNATPIKTLRKIKEDFIQAAGYDHWRSQFPKHNFIFVGRLIHEKSLDLLINSFQSLQLREWGLIIIGSGELEGSLKKMTTSDKVYFEGGKNWREVAHYFSASDVLVLPSNSEPWGLVVNEAMSCALPVITSDACGASYDLVLNRNTGIVFPKNNREELELAMTTLANDRHLRLQMGKNAEELIKNYDPELLANEMWEGFIKFA